MEGFLDVLYISLIVITIFLLARLIKRHFLTNALPQPKYIFVHGIDVESRRAENIAVVKYEVPETTPVSIFVNDDTDPIFSKSHQPGDYFYELSTEGLGEEFDVVIASHNSKITKKVKA